MHNAWDNTWHTLNTQIGSSCVEEEFELKELSKRWSRILEPVLPLTDDPELSLTLSGPPFSHQGKKKKNGLDAIDVYIL